MERTYGVLHLFSGLGGGALGFQQAQAEFRGVPGGYYTIAGIDSDAEACEDFEALTGAPGYQMDLFSREQYKAFHGEEPPADWMEVTPAELRRRVGMAPDVVFTSPPCKGFSGLLPSATAASGKYQALNQLTVRGIWLTLEAWKDDLPSMILLENVPRITSRGAELLQEIKDLLHSYGFVTHDSNHCCGEIGGLAQRRNRYLLIARNPAKVPTFIYQPPQRKLRAIGDVIGPMPLPGDPSMGPMHKLPRLQWRTWLRLALIPAGGDWRDLQDIEAGEYLIQPHMGESTHGSKYSILRWNDPATTVTGSRLGSGGQAVGDPRMSAHGSKFAGSPGLMGVLDWEKPGPTVTGQASVTSSNCPAAIADPRFPSSANRHTSHYRVTGWDEPGGTVTGATHLANGSPSICDPRLGHKPRKGVFQVAPWDKSTGAVIGAASVRGSNGVAAVQDVRLNCAPRSGAMQVLEWHKPAGTVTGSGDVHSQGAAVIADKRIPDEVERGVWIIIALDGTWHRPLTTLELAALQGLLEHMQAKNYLALAGGSDRRWRERIGNMVPVQAATAIAEATLISLLASSMGDEFILSPYGTPVWVQDASLSA